MFDNRHLYKSPQAYALANQHYEEALGRLHVPYQTRYVPTSYGQTHVLIAGKEDAPIVTFWHGLNTNLTMWVDQINLLAPTYRVIAIDTLANMGRSEAVRPDKHSNAYGIWARDVLDALGVEKAHCVGISQGAFIIMKLATVAPHKIQSALLFSGAGIVWIRWNLLARLFMVLVTRPAQRSRAFLKMTAAPDFEPSEADIRDFEVMTHFKMEHRIPILGDAEIRALTAPTWVLVGEHEKTFHPTKVIARVKRLIPNLERVEIVAGISHGWEENKALLNDYLVTFLQQHSDLSV